MLLSTSGAKSDYRKKISDFLALRQTQNMHKYALAHCKGMAYSNWSERQGLRSVRILKGIFPIVYLLIQKTATKHPLCVNVRAVLCDEQQRMNTKGTPCQVNDLVLCVGEMCVSLCVSVCLCAFTVASYTNIMMKFERCITQSIEAQSFIQIGTDLGQMLNSRQPTYMGAIPGQSGHMVTLHSAWHREGQKAS